MKLNPQGYVITKDPRNTNPFWDGGDAPVPEGEGLPPGGESGSMLSKKTAADYDADWVNLEDTTWGMEVDVRLAALEAEGPPGGTLPEGQDGDILQSNGSDWQAVAPTSTGWYQELDQRTTDAEADIRRHEGLLLPVGGTPGQTIIKIGLSDGDADWDNPPTPIPAGTQGDILVYDQGWKAKDPGDISPGGSLGDVLSLAGSRGVEWIPLSGTAWGESIDSRIADLESGGGGLPDPTQAGVYAAVPNGAGFKNSLISAIGTWPQLLTFFQGTLYPGGLGSNIYQKRADLAGYTVEGGELVGPSGGYTLPTFNNVPFMEFIKVSGSEDFGLFLITDGLGVLFDMKSGGVRFIDPDDYVSGRTRNGSRWNRYIPLPTEWEGVTAQNVILMSVTFNIVPYYD